MQKISVGLIDSYNKKHKLEHNKLTIFHHLVEEIGELSREIMKEHNDWRKEGFDKEKLAKELVDVLDKVLVMAHDYEIDLVDTFVKKAEEVKQRFELD